jgi:Tfp pilus assembly protein PilF
LAPFLFLVCLLAISATATGARLQGAPGQDAPRNSESPLAQARAFLADNKVDLAEKAVRGCLVQHQTSADAHFLLGLIRKQGHAEKAKAEFDRFQTLKEVTGTSRP